MPQRSLLPNGLRDGLPPDAAHEAVVLNRLLAAFASYGYQRVDPPLVEFEDTLLERSGEKVAHQTFRLMDPVSQRMMGVRADMTPQVARIAASRLSKAPRPLRLAYAGHVLRVRGSQLQPERQFRQAGAELIGSEEATADIEVILLAHEALIAAGASPGRLTLDINLPTLVPSICDGLGLDADRYAGLRTALDRKDAASVSALGGAAGSVLGELIAATGPAKEALSVLDGLDLHGDAGAERARLKAVIAELDRSAPDLSVTVDPIENRGFEYHTGLSFTFFARGVRGELGCGGRYAAGADGEPASGFSLFLNNLLRAAPMRFDERWIFVPVEAGPSPARQLRAEGWVTVSGLAPVPDIAAEAKRLECGYAWIDGAAVELSDAEGA